MKSIFLTGASGFVGTNISLYLSKEFSITKYIRNQSILLNENTVLHLTGKAHDLKKVSSSDEYYTVNTKFTKEVFDIFLASNAKVFITLSSVKAVADEVVGVLHEEVIPKPMTHYGKSKMLAEQYILSKQIPEGKRVYILRPCMIHGPGNKGNLNLLYSLVSKGLPWPLGTFSNSRSYLSVENLCFIIKELIEREDIPSGVYNVADDLPLSTNEIIEMIAESQNRQPKIWKISKKLIRFVAKLGDVFRLPLSTERLQKLTESYVVSNQKIKHVIGKDLPISAKDGLIKTFKSFNNIK
jgi:nucleoside-diphosphate-sugar epimerase